MAHVAQEEVIPVVSILALSPICIRIGSAFDCGARSNFSTEVGSKDSSASGYAAVGSEMIILPAIRASATRFHVVGLSDVCGIIHVEVLSANRRSERVKDFGKSDIGAEVTPR